MSDELPGHLGQLRGSGYDQASRSSEKPLLGGDALVLAGPGSGGTGSRVLTSHELDRGLVQGLDGCEHHVDNFDVKAVSVVQVLTQWEDDWRHLRGEPAAIVGGTTATVRAAIGYLEVHARWAANEHPDFDGYLDDLQILHGRLERATGRDEARQRAEADCFACGGRLVKELTDSGYADEFTCQRCHETYDWPRYLLALRGRLTESASGWSLPEHVAQVLEVPLATVRSWAQRGMVATACLVTDKRLRVSYEEVAERVRRRREAEQRRREREQRRAS